MQSTYKVKQKTLGQKVRYYRKQYDISQFSLELKTYMSPGSLSRIEKGTVNPTKETLLKLAKALELSNEEILDIFGVEN